MTILTFFLLEVRVLLEIFVLNINSSSDNYEYWSQRLGKFPLPIYIIVGQGGLGVLGLEFRDWGFWG